jgi:hypothetical protein
MELQIAAIGHVQTAAPRQRERKYPIFRIGRR